MTFCVIDDTVVTWTRVSSQLKAMHQVLLLQHDLLWHEVLLGGLDVLLAEHAASASAHWAHTASCLECDLCFDKLELSVELQTYCTTNIEKLYRSTCCSAC